MSTDYPVEIWNRRKGVMTIPQHHQRPTLLAMERTYFPGEAKKSPGRLTRSGDVPFLSSESLELPRATEAFSIRPGRSSDFQIILLTGPSHPQKQRQWPFNGFRP